MKAYWMIKRFLVAFVLLLCIALPARADITLGLAGPFTGSNASYGEQVRHGAEQAVADINTNGGVNGEKLVLQESDDACDPKQAVSVANSFISRGVKFVVGHFCSSTSIPASKAYDEEGVLMVSPASTNPALTDAGFKNVFRTCGRDDQQGSVDAHYILKHFPGKKIAVVHDNSAWGRGIAEELKKTLNAAGTKETLFETITPGERDYSAFISKLKKANIDVAFLGCYFTEVGLIVRQMKEQNAHIQVIGGDALASSEFWSITGPAGEGVLMSFGPDARKLPDAAQALDSIRKGGYEPEGYTLYTYAAVQTVVEGIKRAGKPDPASVATALHGDKPIQTVLGDINFDAKGDRSGSTFVVYQWHNGKYTEKEE